MTGKKRRVRMLFTALLISGIALLHTVGYVEQSEAEAQERQGDEVAEKVTVLQASEVKEKGEVSFNTSEELQALKEMEKSAENAELELYVKRETAEIAVKVKRSGYVWFSNPPARSQDAKASPLYQAELSSQILLTYYNDKGQVNSFNSYTDSVAKQQFEMTATENGMKVVYRFGNIAKGYANIPKVISKERFQERILDQIADEDTRVNVGYKFRLDEEKQIYVVRKLQDYVAEELSAVLEAAGYTAEDAAQDNEENGTGETAAAGNAEFTVPLVYTLDGEQLVVTVPVSELAFNKSYPLASLQILKHFGAADESKEGYLFVPDGSGALIRMNSGKQQTAEPYSLPVYGNDGSYDVKEKMQSNETTRLPVFGLKQNDHALLGIIEDGDAMASITADVSGRNDTYNVISSKFQITSMDFYTLTSGTKTSSVPMFQNKLYEGGLQLRYAFLSGEESDYVGMAARYRAYLVDKHQLKPLAETADAPFILELEGAFRRTKSYLGLPYQATESLTSFAQAQTLLKRLKDENIHHIDLRYVGWFNNGIRHSSPSEIKVVGKLGGRNALRDLAAYAEENQIGFYPDVAFLNKYKGSAGAATLLDQGKAKIYQYDPVMNAQDKSKFSHYILSPSVLPGQVNGFLGDYARLDIGGLSLRDLGDEVNSDFDPGRPVGRQDAQRIIMNETKKLKEQTGSIMVNGGNAYSLPYADIIVNAPTRSSRMNLTDEDIPFYQIVLHGYYDLAGSPFNMEDMQNPRLSLLKALETGSNVFYQWYYSDSKKVKDTDFDHLYALNYEDWLEEAVQLYKEANDVLAKVRNQVIVEHRALADGVVQTVFQNGVVITINYNHTAVALYGLQLEAQSYQVGGESFVQ